MIKTIVTTDDINCGMGLFAASATVLFEGKRVEVGFHGGLSYQTLQGYWLHRNSYIGGEATLIHTPYDKGYRPDYMEIIKLDVNRDFEEGYVFDAREAIDIFKGIR